MSNAKQIFASFESNGSKALDIIHKRAFNPESEKKLRFWGVNDVCKMIGRSRKTLADAEKDKKVALPLIDPTTNKKMYSLEHINTLRDYFGTRPAKPIGSDPAIISVANFKGGVWKTSTCIHAAQYFALKGYRVLIIDEDSQGSVTQCFGYIPDKDIEEKETLLPFLVGDTESIETVIRKTYWPGLDLIPANLALYNAEFILPVINSQKRASGEKFEFYKILKTGLDSVKQNYDIILIDCPPSMGMLSINALYAANALLIPIPPSMLDFSSTVQFFGMLNDVVSKLGDIHYNFIRLLITKHEKSNNAKMLTDIIRQLYGNYVQLSVSPNSEAVKKAGTELRSVYEVEKYLGSKKTLERIIHAMDQVNAELEELILHTWGNGSEFRNDLSAELITND